MYRTSDASSGRKSASANTNRRWLYCACARVYVLGTRVQRRVKNERSARACSPRLATTGSTALHFSHHAAPKSTTTCGSVVGDFSREVRASVCRTRSHVRNVGTAVGSSPCRHQPGRVRPSARRRCLQRAHSTAAGAQVVATRLRRRRCQGATDLVEQTAARTSCSHGGHSRMHSARSGDGVASLPDGGAILSAMTWPRSPSSRQHDCPVETMEETPAERKARLKALRAAAEDAGALQPQSDDE